MLIFASLKAFLRIKSSISKGTMTATKTAATAPKKPIKMVMRVDMRPLTIAPIAQIKDLL